MSHNFIGSLLSDSSPAWSLLRWALDLTLQSTLLLLFAGTVALLLGRASAALRHMVWMLTMGALLTLPLLSLLMPRHIALLPSVPATQIVAPAASNDKQGPAEALGDSVPLSRSTAQNLDTISTSPLVMSNQVGLFCGGLWLIGMLLVASKIIVGLWGIRKLENTSASVVSGVLREQTHTAQESLGFKRPITVRIADSDAPISMPLTWGWRRPVVLLPAGAEAWPPLRQQAVLLHEVAHVARGDWWVLLLTQVTCALFWFNPLVWRAARLMHEESERATDDRVLAVGIRVTDYGECLLGFARSLSEIKKESTMKLTIGMARPSSLEQRLRALLDSGRNRQKISRLHLTVGAASTTLALLSMVTLSVVDAAPRSNTAPRSGTASKTDFIAGDTPTKEDLAIRALILQSSSVEITHNPHQYQKELFKFKPYKSTIGTKELEPLAESFFVSPQDNKKANKTTGALEVGLRGATKVYCRLTQPRKDGVLGVFIILSVDNRKGKGVVLSRTNRREFDLHPLTVNRWVEILTENPHVGPEFRERMKEYKRPR